MTEAIFHLGLFGLGLLHTLPGWRATGAHFAAAAAYPLGLLTWVGGGLVLLVSPLPFSGAGAVAGLLLVAAVGLLRSWLAVGRGGMPPVRVLLAWSASFAAAALLLTAMNVATLTIDSFAYVGTGRSLARFGDLGVLEAELTNMGVFQILVQSASLPMGVPYLHAAAPLLALSGLACFVVLGQRGLVALGGVGEGSRDARRAAAVMALAACAMATPYFMLTQAFYVHTNYAAAVYLLLFCGMAWLAEVEREDAWWSLAFVFLAAFSLQRLELPVFGALFAGIACVEASRPSRRMDASLLLFCLAIGAWYALLSTLGTGETRLLDRTRALVVVIVVLALPALVRLLRSRRARRLVRWVPLGVVVLLLASVVAAAVALPERMGKAMPALLGHLAHPAWGVCWLAIAGLGATVLAAPTLPLQRLFTHGGGAALLGIVLVGAARGGGYHPGLTDSGNRMLTHLVPVSFFFLGVSLGRASGFRRSP